MVIVFQCCMHYSSAIVRSWLHESGDDSLLKQIIGLVINMNIGWLALICLKLYLYFYAVVLLMSSWSIRIYSL